MSSPISNVVILFFMMLLLAFLQPSYQYTYPCNASATCGCSSNPASVSRIVGGESAASSTWGSAVSIAITISGATSLCGGAILSSSWIITAAHCMASVTSASQVTIYAGSNTRFGGQSRVASAITVHPSYLSSTYENDIALIQLSSSLTMTAGVNSICIPSVSSMTLAAGQWPAANLYVVAVGWGRLTEGGSLPSSLQQVTIQTIPNSLSMCSSVLNNAQLQFCATNSGNTKDTCQGDSGGPIMMYTASQQWVLVGVTSYGIGCARKGYAGVYTRVAAYQSWIAATTGNAFTNPTSSSSSAEIIAPPISSSYMTKSASISRLLSFSILIIFVPLFLF